MLGVLLMHQKATPPETLVLRIGDRKQIGVTAAERWRLKEEHEGKTLPAAFLTSPQICPQPPIPQPWVSQTTHSSPPRTLVKKPAV